MQRLQTVAPDVLHLLEGRDESTLRKIAIEASRLAVARFDLRDPTIAAAWNALSQGRYGDQPERSSVRATTDRLDEVAWDVQDRVDEGTSSKPRSTDRRPGDALNSMATTSAVRAA
jgi:hypothetical protein